MSNSSKKMARAARAQKKKNLQYLLWGVVAVALLGGIWWVAQSGESVNEPISLGDPNEGVYEDDHIKGNPDARVTFIEYGDFQCPACASMYPIVKEVAEKYPNDVRIIYRHMPLTAIHPFAQSAAQASEAAAKQGKFWEMHDMLYEKQREWSNPSQGVNPINIFTQYADELGLNLDQFGEDFNSREVRNKVSRDAAAAREIGVRGTPSFVLNGQLINNPGSVAQFSQLIEAALISLPAMDSEPVAVDEQAQLAVFIEGERVNLQSFTQKEGEVAEQLTLTGDGMTLQKNQTGVTLGELFESLGLYLSDACIEVQEGERNCNSNTRSLRFFVNGEERSTLDEYEVVDGDQVLISFGSVDEPVDQQLEVFENES